MAKTVFYVLVDGATEGMRLYEALCGRGCRVRVAPAPRGVTACCGVSLRVEADAIEAVRAALADPAMPPYDRVVELEDTVDPRRDRFC